MGELIITSPNGKKVSLLVNDQLEDHVVDSIISKHLEYYAPTEEYLVDYNDLY